MAVLRSPWDYVARRDAEKSYNLVTFDRLVSGSPGFNWIAWVSALGASSESFAEIVVRQPSFVREFASLWYGVIDPHQLQQTVRRVVGRWVNRAHRRRPMIIPVVIEA